MTTVYYEYGLVRALLILIIDSFGYLKLSSSMPFAILLVRGWCQRCRNTAAGVEREGLSAGERKLYRII